MEKIITLSIVACCENLGFSDKIVSNVAILYPSSNTLIHLMIDLATDYILLKSKHIESKILALKDKGYTTGKELISLS